MCVNLIDCFNKKGFPNLESPLFKIFIYANTPDFESN